tara:strand:+ start:1811 stop:5857 length:4047 start_codon:yes stop_codon:yes gene_type:complete
MLTKFIPTNIQEKLKAKERALGRKSPPQYTEGYLSVKEMSSRTIFVRMCSNKANRYYNYLIEGGLYGNTGKKSFGFESTYDESEMRTPGDEVRGRQRVTDEIFDDVGRKPIPGIKSIEVRYKGGFKAIRECTVNWSVPHIDDLDFLHDSFFTVGRTVVVDWGWIYPNYNIDAQLSDTFIKRMSPDGGISYEYEVDQSIFTNPQDIIQKKNGDYDAIGGQITNFEYNLREDGGFECVTKIISMGAALFKKPIDVGGNQPGLKVSGKDSKSTPPDSLINTILNLRDIIWYSKFGVVKKVTTEKEREAAGLGEVKEDDSLLSIGKKYLFKGTEAVTELATGENTRQRQQNAETEQFLTNNRLYNDYCIFDCKSTNPDDYFLSVDDKKDPNILVAGFWGKSETFVTWGWMEDNIINRYISFNAGSDKDRDVKMTMRSLDTVVDDGGKPILSTTKLTNEQKQQYGIEDIPDAIEKNRVWKTPTLIRNTPGLLPVNPFSFFIPETKYPQNLDDLIDTWFAKEEGIKRWYKFFRDITGTRIEKEVWDRKRFAKEGAKVGALRNIWVNIKEIQKAFGITNAAARDTTTTNINPPGTLDVAINNLLQSLNSNFHDIWDFELMVDIYDTTNIKVVDKSDSEIVNPQYTKYQDGDETDTHRVGTKGIFQFPSYKIGSIVKNQSLAYKIPDAQAITILYGANKKKGESDPQFANGQLDKIFELVRNPQPDRFLQGIESSNSNSSGNEGSISEYVGSWNTRPNSKIKVGSLYGTRVDPRSSWWRTWTPDVMETGAPTGDSGDDDSKNNSEGYYEIIEENKEPTVQFIQDGNIDRNPELYEHDNSTGHIILKDKAQYTLTSYLKSSSPVSQFDMSNLVPAELSLEIDGTGGLTPFDICHTKYIQQIYKQEFLAEKFKMSKEEVEEQNLDNESPEVRQTEEQQATEEARNIGPLTFFQIMDVTHKLDDTGWKTDITAKMRINKFPRDDKLTRFIPPEQKIITKTYKTTGVPNTLSEPEKGVVQKGIQAETDLVEEKYFSPGVASTIPVKEKEVEKETKPPGEWVGPKVINNGIPPKEFTPKVDPDMMMSEEEFNKILENDGKVIQGNDTDFVPHPPKPSPKVKPITPKMKVKPSKNYKTSHDSLLEQIETQKIIDTDEGEVPKVKKFENKLPPVQLDWDKPEAVQIAVNETIKKKLPETIQLPAVDKELDFIDPVSTYQNKTANPDYRVRVKQNELLYSLREDWRPLYIRTAGPSRGKLTGKRITKYNDVKYNNVLVRKKQDLLTIRQPFWDKYIEEKSETGVTKISYTNRDNISYPGGEKDYPKDLIRHEQSVYWYDEEWNPDYEEKKAALKPPADYKITDT